MSDAANFARALIGQGLGMGWGDEAEAWLRSKVSGRPYAEEREQINRQYGQFAQRYPIMAPATEFAGGVLPAIGAYALTPATGGAAAPAAVGATARGAGALSRVAQALAAKPAVRTGAGTAAGAGAGYASDQELATENAIMLGALGAVAGSQAPRIARAVQTPYGRGAAIGATQGAIAGAGSAEPETRGEGAVVGGTIGAPVGAAIPVVARGVGAGWNWLAERVSPSEETITRGAASRINRALEEAGMRPADIETRLAADRAAGIPAVAANVDPALVDLAEVVAQRSGPSARQVESALREQTGGARERVYQRTRTGLGAGDYYADEEGLVRGLRASAEPAYQRAYQAGEVFDPQIMSLLELPQYRGAWATARRLAEGDAAAAQARAIRSGTTFNPDEFKLRDIYRVIGRDPDTGQDIVEIAGTVPDVRTLDYMKRALDAQITSGYSSPDAVSRASASSLRELRDALRDRTKELVPEYRQAVDQYRGDAEILDALRSGMNDFNRLDNEEISKLFRGMNDSERQAFRTGAVRNIYNTIMVPSSNINAAQRLIGSPETRKKLEQLFDSPAQFNLFAAALERESQLYHQANRILQGSPTARRQQARERFEEGPDVGASAADLLTGSWATSLTNMASRAIRGANMNDEISDRVANMLMSRDPTEVAAAVRILEDYGQRAVAAERALSRGEAGTIGGVTSSIFPSPPAEEQPAR